MQIHMCGRKQLFSKKWEMSRRRKSVLHKFAQNCRHSGTARFVSVMQDISCSKKSYSGANSEPPFPS